MSRACEMSLYTEAVQQRGEVTVCVDVQLSCILTRQSSL